MFFFIDYGQKEGEVFIEVVIGDLTVFLLGQSGRKYSHTNSYIFAMTLISQDDHLTAGAWPACVQCSFCPLINYWYKGLVAVCGTYHPCSKPVLLVYVEILTFCSVCFSEASMHGSRGIRRRNRTEMVHLRKRHQVFSDDYSTTNYDIPAGSHMMLVLKLPKEDKKIDFPSSRFNNSMQKISQIFANQMKKN